MEIVARIFPNRVFWLWRRVRQTLLCMKHLAVFQYGAVEVHLYSNCQTMIDHRTIAKIFHSTLSKIMCTQLWWNLMNRYMRKAYLNIVSQPQVNVGPCQTLNIAIQYTSLFLPSTPVLEGNVKSSNIMN